MPRKASAQKSRPRKRARSSKKAKLSKPMKRQILKLVNKNIETKRITFKTGTSNLLTTNTVESRLVLYSNTTQGDTAYQFTGEQIHLKGINIKYTLSNFVQTATQAGWCPSSMVVHMYLLKSSVYSTIGLGASQIFDPGNGNLFQNPQIHHIDKDKVQVIAHRVHTFASLGRGTFNSTDGDSQIKYGNWWIPINRICKFKDWNSSFDLKGGNYYTMFFASVPGTNAYIYNGDLTYDMSVYFKDA